MSNHTGIPLPTAYRAIQRLEDAGIVALVRGKHRGRDLYEASAILDVFKEDALSQAGATEPDLDGIAQQQHTSRAEAKGQQKAEADCLRRQGRTHREIGEALGMSTSWAQAITKGIKRGGQ